MSSEVPVNRRQQYLDQLVARETSPYVRRVIYDHDMSKVRNLVDSYAARALKDHLDIRSKDQLTTELHATVIQYPIDFGVGIKPDVYVFGKAFEKEFVKVNGMPVELPIDKKIRAILNHEYTHCESKFEGIFLEDGLAIDSSNYLFIRQDVTKFVEESVASFREIQFCRQFGIDNPVYLYAVLKFAQHFADMRNFINPNTPLKPFEANLILSQIKKYEEMTAEIQSAAKIYSGV